MLGRFPPGLSKPRIIAASVAVSGISSVSKRANLRDAGEKVAKATLIAVEIVRKNPIRSASPLILGAGSSACPVKGTLSCR